MDGFIFPLVIMIMTVIGTRCMQNENDIDGAIMYSFLTGYLVHVLISRLIPLF